jgi:hypothetical protein
MRTFDGNPNVWFREFAALFLDPLRALATKISIFISNPSNLSNVVAVVKL